MKKVVLIIFLLALMAISVGCGEYIPDDGFGDPEKVGVNFFKALKRRDKKTAVLYCDSSVIDNAGLTVGHRLSTPTCTPEEIYDALSARVTDETKISKVIKTDKYPGCYFYVIYNNTSNIFHYVIGLHENNGKWMVFMIHTYEDKIPDRIVRD